METLVKKKTPLVVIATVPVLADCDQRIAKANMEASQKIDELKRMARRIVSVRDAIQKSVLEEIERYAETEKLLPEDYSKDRYALIVENGVLYIEPIGEHQTGGCGCVVCTFKRNGLRLF